MQNGASSRTVALARQSSITNRKVLTRGESLPISSSGAPPLGLLSGSTSLQSQSPSLGADGRLVDYESLISHFDCPVCHDWVTPPVIQCRKGHIVCGPCKSKGLKACPICKQRFSDVPNLMIEQVRKLCLSSLKKFFSWTLFVRKKGGWTLKFYIPSFNVRTNSST